MIVLVVLALLATTVALLAATFLRVARNVGPMTLEDYARRNQVIFVPIAKQLADDLQDWSFPVRLRLDTHRHELLAELLVQKLEDQ